MPWGKVWGQRKGCYASLMEEEPEHCMIFHGDLNYCDGEDDCICGCKSCDSVNGIELPHEDD